MKNSERQAFPLPSTLNEADCPGLSKREYFAGLALQGLLTNPDFLKGATINMLKDGISLEEKTAEGAVEMADELLKRLEK